MSVHLALTDSEAMVLFELLSRFSETDVLAVQDSSEQRALWNLHSLLEQSLPAVLQDDYAVRLAAARQELRDDADSPDPG